MKERAKNRDRAMQTRKEGDEGVCRQQFDDNDLERVSNGARKFRKVWKHKAAAVVEKFD